MQRGGPRVSGSGTHRLEGFATRPFRTGDAVRALDETLTGLRTLGLFAGRSEAQIEATADLTELVRSASAGMPSYLGPERRTAYNTLFLAAGEACRRLLSRLHRPAALDRVTDPVVAASLASQVGDTTSGPGATLLRMAMAAELSGRTDRAARNPLRGVLDLYAMGAVISTRPGEGPALTLSDGASVSLEWTGRLLSQGAGRLRPSDRGVGF